MYHVSIVQMCEQHTLVELNKEIQKGINLLSSAILTKTGTVYSMNHTNHH